MQIIVYRKVLLNYIMEKLLLILILLTPLNVLGTDIPSVFDGRWNVTDFIGVRFFEDFQHHQNDETKYQEFLKGSSEGTFYNCDFKGQSKGYNTYSIDEFLNNSEMKLFKKYKDELQLTKETIFVHRINCTGSNDTLYPFVTQYGTNKAYFPFDRGIYVLEHDYVGFK